MKLNNLALAEAISSAPSSSSHGISASDHPPPIDIKTASSSFEMRRGSHWHWAKTCYPDARARRPEGHTNLPI